MTYFKAAFLASVIALGLVPHSPAYSNDQASMDAVADFILSRREKEAAAKREFERALEQAQRGDKEAQYKVGRTYASVLKQDDKSARQWFLKSAKQGYMPAQEQLGEFFYHGRGGEKDLEQAFHWFQKAADQDSIKAITFLAYMYRDGEGVPVDRQKALELFETAAVRSQDTTTISSLVDVYKYHFPEQGTRRVYWMDVNYEKGQWHSRDLVAAYSEGKLVPKNDAKTFYYLDDIYRRGKAYPDQFFQLAALYEEGRGVVKDAQKAEELYNLALEAGYSEAELNPLLHTPIC